MDDTDREFISSLVGSLRVGSTDQWEVSEPTCVGGPNGAYTCRSPFVGDCEWTVDFASCGASTTQIVISSTRKTSGVDFTGLTVFTELSPFDGIVLNLMPNNTIPGTNLWYPVKDSNNTLYVLVVNATNAAFVNIQFRQKRSPNGTNNPLAGR